ncbi:MAG TPA: EXLDI protein [Chloroflexota bacterium]|nr:EXLDI protein [Chloroflexota bacterium]
MPNKTIYVSDDDLPLYQRAQELAGGSLSAAITSALRRYIEVEEGRREGYEEITVRVGPGGGRKQRFSGVLLGEWGHSTGRRVEQFRVYRTRTGRFVVHVKRSPDWTWTGTDAGSRRERWRAYLGLGEQSWGFTKGESTLEVVDSLDGLREKIPPELYDMVASAAEQPAIEDLDI